MTTLYKYGAILFIILGLGTTIWIQSGRIDRLKDEVKALKADVATAVAANKTNTKTIDDLKAEREKSKRSCDKTIADKNALIDELNTIDATTGGNDAIRNPQSEIRNASSDALLDLLNGMLPAPGGEGAGICEAAGSGSAEGAEVVPGAVLPPLPPGGGWYCLNEVNAKNLLKDWALCRAWAQDGVQAIEGMK